MTKMATGVVIGHAGKPALSCFSKDNHDARAAFNSNFIVTPVILKSGDDAIPAFYPIFSLHLTFKR